MIYYYHSVRVPVFLLTVYPKSRKVDLSAAERAAMRRIAVEIVKQYTARKPRGQ